MRLLVIGSKGQVGFELVRAFQPLGEVLAWTREHADLERTRELVEALDRAQPDVIVNCAAYTGVDAAETDEAAAWRVNAEAPSAMSAWAKLNNAAFIHFSTDYVFDGEACRPLRETDPLSPLSVYGRSKAAGESAVAKAGASHVILRTSWVYATRGHNFMRTVLRLARERKELRIVNDQQGAPTWARSIAEATAAIVARAGADRAAVARSIGERGGIFHLTCGGVTSWFHFAKRILELVPDGRRVLERLDPIPTSQYPTPARRPTYSVLDNQRIADAWGIRLPSWDVCLAAAVEEWAP